MNYFDLRVLNKMNNLPIIITSGEPSGIGPEIVIKAYKVIQNQIPMILMGDEDFLKTVAYKNNVNIKKINEPEEVEKFKNKLCFINLKYLAKPIPGTPNPINSKIVLKNIVNSVNLVLTKKCSALVTSPIDKGILKDGSSFDFPGHTELLADLCKIKSKPIMMMMSKKLKIVPITTHIPLREVSNILNIEYIFDYIKNLENEIKYKLNIKSPKILVTGLNPHAGENGKIGNEEQTIIKPAIEKLKKFNINISGPISADTAFLQKNLDFFDVIVCMYHDQALIPIKLLDFYNSINITLGLPIIRTSPDHGTAYNIAGKNISDPSSMIFAIEKAYSIYKNLS